MYSATRFIQLQFTVICLVGFGGTLPTSEFYSFGQGTGDARLPKNDDGSSGRVQISTSFPFFDKNFDSLFVNTNGAVSFGVQISQYTPDSFPLGGNRRLLSPFWADVDTRRGGDVWYREEKSNQSLLRRATNDVRAAFVTQKRFTASWLYIVTWNNVAFYGSKAPHTSKRNTFQAVLITNGRHSFVIYNYHKIQWTTGKASGGNIIGLGGKPAQCGFNAGDGVRFFTIPGSRTAQVLTVPLTTTNVGKPGKWMFRIDNTEIESGGCNTKGSLTVFPSVAPMLGGVNIALSGPCYMPNDTIVCEFAGQWRSAGVYLNDMRAICTVPLANRIGRVEIRLSRDGGITFPYRGIFTYVSLARMEARVHRSHPLAWVETRQMQVTWNPIDLGSGVANEEGSSSSPDVMVRLARYTMDSRGRVGLHDLHTVVTKQRNTGISRFTVPTDEGDGTLANRFVTLVQVIKTPPQATRSDSSHQWIWSDVFTWQRQDRALPRCLDWYNKEPDAKRFTEDTTFLPCPRNLVQAMADRGRFTEDEHCNLKNEKGCLLLHRGARTCFRSITSSDKGAGTQCCYNTHGNLMVGPPNAGSLDRAHIDTGIPYISHYFHDIVPYLDCCVYAQTTEEKRCHDYYEKRPSDNGKDYEAPRPAGGFGDPHMVTLDGVEYTFNGYGEFTLLRVPSPGFDLQGRMRPLTTNVRGSVQMSKATVYTAFAMKETGSDTVQIQLNGRGRVDVLVNREKVDLDEEGMREFRNVLVLKQLNESKYSAIFHSGISVTIQGYQELLQVMLLAPPKFKGNTTGLLGFWDGNTNKEFLLPDGSFIDTESPAEKIHTEFGMKWLTTPNESLFTYERGQNHSSHVNLAYTPVFIERGSKPTFNNSVLERKARAACGENVQCLFDVSATGKTDIGLASRHAVQEFKAIVNTTESKVCAPLESDFPGGVMNRTDTSEDISYKFTCNQGFELNGTAEMSCKAGEWSAGNKPNCIQKDESTTSPPSIPKKDLLLFALIALGCVLAIVLVSVYLVYRRHKSNLQRKQEGRKRDAHAQPTVTYTNEDYGL